MNLRGSCGWRVDFVIQNAVAGQVHDETNVPANESLEFELMREVDDVFEPVMKIAFSKPPCSLESRWADRTLGTP